MTIQGRAELAGWLTIRRVSGVAVTYSRPSPALSGPLTVVPGDTLVEAIEDSGTSVKLKVRDYLIRRSELEAILGAGEEPTRGDSIIETVADYSRTFDLIELGGEAFRWWTKGGLVYRVHTVEVEKVTTTTTTAGA